MTQPVQIETGSEPIIIVGDQLVSTKMMEIIQHFMTATDFGRTGGVKEFHFTEDFPADKFGGYDHKTKTVVINLQRHFDATVDAIKSDKDNTKYLSFRTMLWYDLLTTICHELFHGVAWSSADPDSMDKAMADPEQKQDMCDECNDAANDFLIEFFREYDVEAPQLSEEPFFGTRFMQLFINEIRDGNEEWAVRQNIMQESNFVYYDDERDDSMVSMREWLRSCAGADPDFSDERWDAAPKPLTIVEHVPEVKVPEPDGTVTEQTEIPWKTDEAVADITDAEELMAMSIDDEEPIELGDEVEITPLPAEPAAQPVQAVPVAEPPAAPHTIPGVTEPVVAPVAGQKTCVCGAIHYGTHAEAKFCSNCGADMIVVAPAQTSTIADIRTMGPTPLPVVPAPLQGALPAQSPQPAFTVDMRTDLPDINIDQATMRVLLDMIYMRLHEHCFGKCGFQLCGGTTGNAAGWNPGLSGNILQPVPIGDLVHNGRNASELVIACDKYNPGTQKNQLKQPVADGMITGWVAKTSGVPHYALYLNNNGTEVRRIFSPQNPFSLNRMKSDYSENAYGAQSGNQISWVWIGNADGSRTWYYKIENGLARWLV